MTWDEFGIEIVQKMLFTGRKVELIVTTRKSSYKLEIMIMNNIRFYKNFAFMMVKIMETDGVSW